MLKEHELKIDSTTDQFELMKDENGQAMYNIETVIGGYRNPLTYTYNSWSGGHGQHDFESNDMYFEGQSIDTTQEGRVILGPLINEVKESDDSDLDSAPVKFLYNPTVGELLCATSGKIYRYDVGSNGKWTAASTTVAGVTDLAIYKGVVFAARGASNAYMYSSDDDTWTTSTLTDNKANGFLVSPDATGLNEVLWKFKTPNEIASATTGINGATGLDDWTTPAFIGDTTNNIIRMFLLNNQIMVGKTDGLWHYDADGNQHQQRPDLKANRSTDNFKYVTEWQAGVYHSEIEGMGEIWSYNNYSPMGPLFRTGDIGKRGTTVGLAADKDWLYSAKDEGTNTIIYKGREVRKASDLRWEWCPWVFLGTKTTSTMAVVQHSTTDRRLWFGYSNTTAYVILSDNPTSDAAARFAPSGFVRMSYDNGTDLNNDKLYQSAVLQVTGGASGETVQVKYRKDTDTSATSIIAAAATNGVYETNFSSAITTNRVQFELHLASDTPTTTPEVSHFQAKGIEKPTTVRIHEAVYSVSSRPTKRSKTERALLRLAGTTTNLIRFADLRFGDSTVNGQTYVYVVMEPGWPREISVRRDKKAQPEMGIQVKLREVSYSLT